MAPFLGGSSTNEQSDGRASSSANRADVRELQRADELAEAEELRRFNYELQRSNTELQRASEVQRTNQNGASGRLIPNGLVVNTSLSNCSSDRIEIDSPASATLMLASIIVARNNRERARAQGNNQDE
ncbi:hypothetical protein K3495_g222 [Podosphaera aphanis]|nr:hypothetical protein K3495_g222 [Podosphaera aphanis]